MLPILKSGRFFRLPRYLPRHVLAFLRLAHVHDLAVPLLLAHLGAKALWIWLRTLALVP